MSGWNLELRHEVDVDVDASPIRLNQFVGKSVDQAKAIGITCGSESRDIGELFLISRSDESDTIRMLGNFSRFHHIAAKHDRGFLFVEGDVGDYLSAPSGASRSGMSGGRVVVSGSAGNYVGHRMRRGEIAINGSVGDFLGCHLIAGTIMVGGHVGRCCGYAMRRGTLFLSTRPELSDTRFSSPVSFPTPFFSLFQRAWEDELQPDDDVSLATHNVQQLLERIADGGFVSIRGDFAVGGQGEIVLPR